jgi:SAM-dependent methyltransferase
MTRLGGRHGTTSNHGHCYCRSSLIGAESSQKRWKWSCSMASSKNANGLTKLRLAAQEALERAYHRANVTRYYRSLRRRLGPIDSKFDAYLLEQLEHTLEKKRFFGSKRAAGFPFIDILGAHVDLRGKQVLCVGARNDDEIICFRKAQVGKVVGIDLYSDSPDILVMDMHALAFPDNSFDVVYSRHSYEHAYDKRKAAMEFVRVARTDGIVAIEVPGNYKGGADVNVFRSFNDVTDSFDSMISDIIFKQYSKKEENKEKMDIFRVIMKVKSREHD